MEKLLESGVPALFALLGTILTVFVGYRQWMHQQNTSRSQKFKEERECIYKQLWEMLEDVHIKLRLDSQNQREFDELIMAVNHYILKNSLHVDDVDGHLAVNYLDQVQEVSQLVALSKDRAVKRQWHMSGRLSPDLIERDDELGIAWEKVNKLRGELIVTFQKVISRNPK